MTYEKIFEIFCADKHATPMSCSKEDFVEAV